MTSARLRTRRSVAPGIWRSRCRTPCSPMEVAVPTYQPTETRLRALRRAGVVPPVAPALFVPIPFLLLTLRAQENLLKGFQICIHLCLLASFASWFLLGNGRVPARRLGASIALGLAAMLSFGSGLLVAPVGLVQVVW